MDNPIETFINNKSKRAQEYHQIIEDMMSDYFGAYNYAEDTLLGILDYIEENDDITDAQMKAVENIKEEPSQYND